MQRTVILSPHFDDAVCNTWHLICQPEATVLTVFGGIPKQSTSTIWDRLCGEPDSHVMVQRRQDENAAALEGTPAKITNLAFLDNQYTTTKYQPEEIVQEIVPRFDKNTHYYAPIAAGRLIRHLDHVLLRQVGQLLHAQGRQVSYYTDMPYMQLPTSSSPGFEQRSCKRVSRLLGEKVSIEVTNLRPEEQALKRAALAKYQSQYKMTNLVAFGTLDRKANIIKEVLFDYYRLDGS